MSDSDENLSRRYRDLPREEPSAAIDQSIIAAARRAARPARASQRWAMPVSLAAILVLAVGVTLRMQRESPGIESSPPASERPAPPSANEPIAPPATPPPAQEPAVAQTAPSSQAKARERRPAAARRMPATSQDAAAPADRASARDLPSETQTQSAAIEARKSAVEHNVEAPKRKPFADALAPSPQPAPVPPSRAEGAATAGAAPRAQGVAPGLKAEAANAPVPASPAAAPAPSTAQTRSKRDAADERADLAKEAKKGPLERELERIAQLRREGRHAEADEALAKFRRENPDYRIPDALWDQLKPPARP